MRLSRRSQQFAGLMLLLTLVVGGVMSPVVAHAFHPHSYDASVEAPAIDSEAPATYLVHCVLCEAASFADVPPVSFVGHVVPSESIDEPPLVPLVGLDTPALTARGPPGARS